MLLGTLCVFVVWASGAAQDGIQPFTCDTIALSIEWVRVSSENNRIMIATAYPYITIDENGTPCISGTTMKLVELILDNIAYGWSPEELHFQHPYLSMGQIHSALAYYWDHKQAVDQDIERRLALANSIERELQPSRLDERLRKKGLL